MAFDRVGRNWGTSRTRLDLPWLELLERATARFY
jgi:hypothetical protein